MKDEVNEETGKGLSNRWSFSRDDNVESVPSIKPPSERETEFSWNATSSPICITFPLFVDVPLYLRHQQRDTRKLKDNKFGSNQVAFPDSILLYVFLQSIRYYHFLRLLIRLGVSPI